MPTLEKVQSDSLSSDIKQLWELDEDEEVYLKIIRSDEVARIEQKIQEHEGLTHSEMEIAADLGLIDREQFWYWTPEAQAQVRDAEADLAAGRYETFGTVDDLFAALDDDT
jgi:hypothetical protein